MSRPRRGILGGTFNPVHHGHLFLALEAAYQFSLDSVLLVPNRTPPHKEGPSVSGEQRFLMLQAAVQDDPRLEVSRVELDREGKSYTLHTLEALKSEGRLFFICGADAFRVPWYQPEQVLERLSGLVLAHRHQYPDELPDQLARLPAPLRKKIHRLAFPDIAISSTDIRRRTAQGRPTRYLMPPAVCRYIEENGLYREGAAQESEKGVSLG